VGRQVFSSIPHDELPLLLEKILRGYLRRREASETFQAFTTRHDLNTPSGHLFE
jgi:ferredoxin-nitrite reductase